MVFSKLVGGQQGVFVGQQGDKGLDEQRQGSTRNVLHEKIIIKWDKRIIYDFVIETVESCEPSEISWYGHAVIETSFFLTVKIENGRHILFLI